MGDLTDIGQYLNAESLTWGEVLLAAVAIVMPCSSVVGFADESVGRWNPETALSKTPLLWQAV